MAAVPPAERTVIDNEYIRDLLWQQRADLGVALLCALLCTVSNLAAPVISGYFIEILAGRQPSSLYPKLLAGMAVMYTVEPLLGRVYVTRGIRAVERVLTALRAEVFRVLLMQPLAFFDKHGATELTNVLSVDLDTLRSCLFANISRDRGLRAVLEATGSIVVLFVLSWRLAPVLGTIIVSTGIAAALYRKATRNIEARMAQALRSLSRVAGQAFRNVRTVRSFAGENLERERFLIHVNTSYVAGMQFANAKAWLEAANRGSIHASLLILFALGGWLVSNDHMPLRVMLTGIGFTYSLLYATQGTVNSMSDFRKASSALARVRDLLNSTRAEPQVEAAVPPGEWWLRVRRRRPLVTTPDSVAAARNGAGAASNGDAHAANSQSKGAKGKKERVTPRRPMPLRSDLEPWIPQPGEITCPIPFRPMPDDLAAEYAATGDLKLDSVTFAYPMRPGVPVLEDVSCTLRHGEITALVGRSGAGKSTVANLISRFYTPHAGLITMGGIDIHAWSRTAWSDAVALVAQEPVLFSATVADNIAYGRPQATRAEVVDAAHAANAHEFIAELEDGYETQVGEQGLELSGGQRQRVAIARALLKNAPVLILDEATSSLDIRSERLVSEAIARLVKGRTVLVIAHRLSTIQRSDTVIVLDGGLVAEQGPHEALLRRGGTYADLVDSQSLTLKT